MISSWYWSTNIKSYEYILNIKIKFKLWQKKKIIIK